MQYLSSTHSPPSKNSASDIFEEWSSFEILMGPALRITMAFLFLFFIFCIVLFCFVSCSRFFIVFFFCFCFCFCFVFFVSFFLFFQLNKTELVSGTYFRSDSQNVDRVLSISSFKSEIVCLVLLLLLLLLIYEHWKVFPSEMNYDYCL